jgi:hypothetical protein
MFVEVLVASAGAAATSGGGGICAVVSDDGLPEHAASARRRARHKNRKLEAGSRKLERSRIYFATIKAGFEHEKSHGRGG